jgi:hypothetical protein
VCCGGCWDNQGATWACWQGMHAISSCVFAIAFYYLLIEC